MAIKSPLEEFIVSRKYNEKEQRPVMDYETPINVESDAIASDAEMAPYMQGVYDEETPSVVEQEEAIEQAVRQPAAQPQQGSPDSNLWYFLPAALGALTGNIGEGSAASAGAIGDARKRQFAKEDSDAALNKKLKEMALLRSTKASTLSGRGNFQVKYLENPKTGAIEAYQFDTQTGAISPLNQNAGFALQVRDNPLTGQSEVVSKATGKASEYKGLDQGPTQKVEPNSLKGISVVKDFEKEVAKDPEYIKQRDRLSAAKDLATYVNNNSKLSAKALAPALTFFFEGAQRLTDEDVTRYRLPEGWVERFDELIQMGTGKEGLTPEFRGELAGMVELLAAKASEEGQNVLGSKLQDFQSNYGFNPSDRVTNLYRPFKEYKVGTSKKGPITLNIPKVKQGSESLRGMEPKAKTTKSYEDMSVQELEALAKKRGIK